MPAARGGATILAIDDLAFAYVSRSQTVPVLNAVDLDVAAGEWVAVMGPSGSGKSTLLLCAAGLRRAQSGRVVLDGIDLATATDKQLTALRRGQVGFVFQEFNLVPALTAEQNVGLPSRFGGVRRTRAEIAAALHEVGLAEKGSQRPDELSGGERQRVAVARALVSHPSIVFADEPTGSLDVRSRDRVLDLFDGLVANGAGVLMVTHDPLVAARADRVLWLSSGRIADVTSKASAEQIALRLAALEAAPS
jgi:putative ABC transport system ATP-binding protein